MSVGDTLDGYNHTKYAQPRIDYRLHAVVTMRSPDGDLKTIIGDKEITIMPCAEPSPPVDISDFSDEFVGSASNPFRSSLFGTRHIATISMPEPSAISIGPLGRPSTVLRLTVEIQADSINPYPLIQGLKNLNFKIQPLLRAKTYYSLRPFPKMPSQDMATEEGPIRLHDSVLKIPEVNLVSTSWHSKLLDDVPSYEDAVRSGSFSKSSDSSPLRRGSQSSTAPPTVSSSLRAWNTSLSVPVEFTGTLLPTFCSAVASRQYSVIARVRIKGAKVKEFVLEVPLQVHYLPCAAALSSSDLAADEPLRPGRSHHLLSDDLVRKLNVGDISFVVPMMLLLPYSLTLPASQTRNYQTTTSDNTNDYAFGGMGTQLHTEPVGCRVVP